MEEVHFKRTFFCVGALILILQIICGSNKSNKILGSMTMLHLGSYDYFLFISKTLKHPLHSGLVPWEIFCVFIITMCVVNCAPHGNLLYKSNFEPLGLRTVDYNGNK